MIFEITAIYLPVYFFYSTKKTDANSRSGIFNLKKQEGRMEMPVELKVFSLGANDPLAKSIADYLEIGLGSLNWVTFSDGEREVNFEDDIREKDIFLIQPTNQPDSNFTNLCIALDAAKRASAKRITAVPTYFGWARQDRKTKTRAPITAKLMANILTAAGADRILTLDLHAAQIQGFFDIPVDNLYARPIFLDHYKLLLKNWIETDSLVIIAPDSGATRRARSFAKNLGLSYIATADKWRPAPNQAVVDILTRVKLKDKVCLILDDMVDTFGTIKDVADKLMEMGTAMIFVACAHPVLSGPAIERIQRSPIVELCVTDTVLMPPQKKIGKIKVLTVAPLIGEAIKRINRGKSVSCLFN